MVLNAAFQAGLMIYFQIVWCPESYAWAQSVSSGSSNQDQYENAQARQAALSSTISYLMEAKLKTDTYESMLTDRKTGKCEQSDLPTTCSICLLDFESGQRVTALKCDHRHIFHSACLRQSLEFKLKCPICRKPVLDQFAADDEAIQGMSLLADMTYL